MLPKHGADMPRRGIGLALALMILSMAPLAPIPALAQNATENVILTVTLSNGAEPKTLTYDLAGLEALPKTSFETTTQWTEGLQTFDGVEVKDFLAALGVTAGTMAATAKDGYLIEIPVADMLKSGPMLAYNMNGTALGDGDKGPVWLVYPYDRAPEFNTEETTSRSIWQLVQIEITQ
jgi:hypothetical protein